MKRAIEVSLVKKNQQTEGPRLDGQPVQPTIQEMSDVFKDQVEFLFGLAARAYIGKKVVDTIAEIAKRSL